MKRILLFIIWLSLGLGCVAQTDTEFWFAAPDLEVNHAQQPIRFCVVSYDVATTVVFEQPANAFYSPQTFHLEANDCFVYDVSDIIGIVETQPYNTVLDYGFHIRSDAPVSIYYESDNNNSEIYSLKGRNALGTSFVVPMQYTFENFYSSTCSRIEVVASEDDTEVTFVPSVPIKDFGQAGVPITVRLDRGQSYAIEAASPQGSAHLRNTRITSTKPIAVNSSDDSVNLGGHYDLVGDQIVPVDLLGTDYIAIWNNNPDEYLYFFPTADDTRIYTNGGAVPIATLDVGEEYMCQMTSAVMYIHADKPISVFQLSSSSLNEFGGTVLPQISCTGSLKTVYKRQSTSNLVVTLIVGTPYTDGFVLNGNSTCITASDFSPVPAAPDYSYCKKNVTNYVPTNGLMSLENTYANGYFHLGILTGVEGDTWNYGYFSDYQPYAFAEFQMDDTYCSGQDIEFVYSMENVANLVLVLPNGEEEPLPFVLTNAQPEHSGLYALRGEDCNGVRVLDEMEITINGAGETTVTLADCNSVEWHGHTFTHSIDTVWTVHSPGSGDCDSIYMLHFTVFPPNDTSIVDVGICVGESYNFHGTLYNQDGQTAYFDTIDNHGCLKVEKLVLSVGEYQTQPTEYEYVCYAHNQTPYFIWDKNNVVYTADADDEAIVPDPAGGCDFKFRLHLEFHQEFYKEEIPIVACDEYVWPVTGEVFTATDHHVERKFPYLFFDKVCDSTYVLDITIDDSPHPSGIKCDEPSAVVFGDTVAVVTNTEFFSFSYPFYVEEDSMSCIWDSCIWSISKPSWAIVFDTLPERLPDGRYASRCMVYVAEHDEEYVQLSANIKNGCGNKLLKLYLKPSFLDVEEQASAPSDFSVVPNPNNGTMALHFENMEGKVEVKVYDVTSNMIDRFVAYNDANSKRMAYSLDVRKGLYFFVVNGAGRTMVKKVMIE